MKFAALLVLLLSQAAHANGLEDLKTALATLQGTGAMRGTFDVRETRTDLDAKPAKGPESAAVSALVEEDGNGLAIRWDHGLLKKVADEAKLPKDKKRPMGVSDIMGQISARSVAQAVNYAPNLLQYLQNGQLRAERMDAYNGKPARLIEVLVTPPNPDADKVKMKDNSHVARIWLSPDNLPLAATIYHTIKASFMVFLSFEQSSKEEMTFSVQANRLLVLKRDDAGKEKGPGSESEYRRQVTFIPKA